MSPRGGNRLERGAIHIFSQNDASFNPFMASIARQVWRRPFVYLVNGALG